MRIATVDLAVEHRWVDRLAHVMGDDISQDVDVACLWIYRHARDVAAAGHCERPCGIELLEDFETSFGDHLGGRNATRGSAAHRDHAILQHQVIGGCLEHPTPALP